MADDAYSVIRQGAEAYVRFLVAAEDAVVRGQFNLAKMLRALAYSQRTVAMTAARTQTDSTSPEDLLTEQFALISVLHSDGAYQDMPTFSQNALDGWLEISERALDSLKEHPDVPEWIVDQRVFVCLSCGNIFEGTQPHFCTNCGALSTEFEFFGPFYGASDEHLGQLMPAAIMETLTETPDKVEALVTDIDEPVLTEKPSDQEWSVKELIAHLIETDIEFLKRMGSLLTGNEYRSSLPPWKLHEGKGYEEMSKEELCELLRSGRAEILEYISNLTSQDWAKSGSLVGDIRTALDTGTWLANHDLGHIAQIERVLK